MITEQIQLNSLTNRIIELAGQSPVSNKDLIVVDIQPEYQSSIPFLREFVKFLNSNYKKLNRLIFLYNGADTLGMISESELQMWWLELGLKEHIIDNSIWFDKGYAYFRYCIDSNISDESTVNLVKFMLSKNINDTRELDVEFWDEYIETYGDADVRELLEFADDMINIPDLMDELVKYNNIIMCGGGINECLKEVEIALNALGKPFKVLTQFTY
jgi:hypothetical protein